MKTFAIVTSMTKGDVSVQTCQYFKHFLPCGTEGSLFPRLLACFHRKWEVQSLPLQGRDIKTAKSDVNRIRNLIARSYRLAKLTFLLLYAMAWSIFYLFSRCDCCNVQTFLHGRGHWNMRACRGKGSLFHRPPELRKISTAATRPGHQNCKIWREYNTHFNSKLLAPYEFPSLFLYAMVRSE